MQMLREGRIDIAIMFDKVVDYTLEKMEKSKISLKKSFTVHESEIFVTFNKKSSKSRAYSQQLDDGLKRLKKKGRIKEILKERNKQFSY
jgi:ABC-type amino acid transport substrate-binding protein